MSRMVVRMTKALLAAYAMSALLLLLLAFLLYRLEISESVVTGGIVSVYLISTLAGGFVMGKMMKVRKFFWGILTGCIYFGLLLLISVGICRGVSADVSQILTSLLLCAGGGMLGGMIS